MPYGDGTGPLAQAQNRMGKRVLQWISSIRIRQPGDIGRLATRRDTTEDMRAEDMVGIRAVEEAGEDSEKEGKERR